MHGRRAGKPLGRTLRRLHAPRVDTLDELKLAPFNLDAEGVAWVKKTCDSLGTEDKVHQIYCPLGIYDDPDNARRLAQLKPGG